jgi:Domain of unknown function (DUF4249)
MNRIKISLSHLFIYVTVLLLTSCEDVIKLDIPTGASQLVVDGWVTDQVAPQTIRLTESGAYFDNGKAKPVLNATVIVTDERKKIFVFKDLKNDGKYVWQPAHARDTLGHVGGTYNLSIKFGNEEYQAVSKLNRSPKIDSITYYFDKFPITPTDSTIPKEGYVAEFYGRDFKGEGDCYWIKAYKNNKYWDKTFNIIVAYDAGFSPGAATDGLQFILPIRRSITPQFYQAKDTVRVEIFSLGLDGFYFLNQVRQESNNAGIFATPPANIFTNIRNTNSSGRKALGFFGSSAISSFQTIIDPKKAKPKP